MQIKYKFFPRPSNGDAETILKIDKQFGATGYVYKGRVNTVSNKTFASSYVYINIDNSKAPYQYRALIKPSTSAELLKQVNEQGVKGFRLKADLRNNTAQFYEYVRDASRPSAKYTYRHGPCVSNTDELFAQINKNAAQGYRVLDTLPQDNRCFLYIKDTSKHFKFVYEKVSDFNSTEDLLAKSDQLGAQGYRYVGGVVVGLLSDGQIKYSSMPLFYRDTTEKDCTFSYSSALVPDSPDNALAVLQEQEAKGFVYAFTFFDLSVPDFKGFFLIFVKFQNCHYKGLNIDTQYWFLLFPSLFFSFKLTINITMRLVLSFFASFSLLNQQ